MAVVVQSCGAQNVTNRDKLKNVGLELNIDDVFSILICK